MYWRMTRGLTLGVRAVVVDDRERVFLVRHTYTNGWHFPGGGVEPGESALDALRRELQEEAGIETAAEPRLHGVFFNRAVSLRDHVVVYRIDEFEVAAPKSPDLEIAESGFFPIAAPPPDTNPGTLRRLRELAGDAPVSPEW
ncbi:MAG TPA: NUDIX domain-containing protein [Saliniramus sp.]|nr:NUDIX domain-containing protein [Saliniramus sp.]